ncbi:MAG: glycosyl hydrolase family 28-related protein [Pyrinomonadaceae bacterium]
MKNYLQRMLAGLACVLCLAGAVEARQKLEGFAGITEPSIASADITAASLSIKTFPGCTVTVYITGTDTLANIYANESGATKENPFIAESTTAAWSFYADNGRYDIRFSGAGIDAPFMQEGVKALDAQETFNVKNYGAKGKGAASDDTAAIQTAVKDIEFVRGGKLIFPTGVYHISSKISLPSGIVVEGTNSNYFGNCRIQLTADNQSIFFIGGNRRRITIRDLELKANTTNGTKGIEAAGEYPNSSFQIEFDNLSISGFDRGISVEGHGPRGEWQFENVRVHHTAIGDCKYGIYLNTMNSDYWKIEDCPIGSLSGGYGIYLERSGLVNLDGTYGSGPGGQPPAKTFIFVGGMHSNLTIINAHCEYYTNWMEVVQPHNAVTPITVISSSIHAPILLRANCQFVSIGNNYYPDTIQTVDQGTSVPIYSVGDSFTTPAGVLSGDFKLQNDSRLAIRSNFARNDFQNPARFTNRVGVGNIDAPADVLLNLATHFDGMTHLRIGGSGLRPDAQGKLVESCPSCYYNIRRDTTPEAIADGTLGFLSFKGNQSNYTGYSFNGPIVTSGDLLPAANGTGNIGNNSRRWNLVRAVTITPGDVVLSDRQTGKELYRIHEDENNIYFDDIRTGAPMMRLDRDGNLHLSGKIYQNSGRAPKPRRRAGRRARR